MEDYRDSSQFKRDTIDGMRSRAKNHGQGLVFENLAGLVLQAGGGTITQRVRAGQSLIVIMFDFDTEHPLVLVPHISGDFTRPSTRWFSEEAD